MAAGNLSAGLMDPKTRALYANLLRRPNVTITQNTASAQRPSNIEGMRIQDQQRQMAQTRDALNTVDPGFGYYAPLAGVIKGIASNISRGQQEKTLDELYGQYAAAQQAERAQAAQAAEAARLQKIEDERQAADEQLERDMRLRQVLSPEQKLALQQGNLTLAQMRQQMQAAEAEAEANRQAAIKQQAGAQAEAEAVRANREQALKQVDQLLSTEPVSGPLDYFPPVAAYNFVSGLLGRETGRTPLEQASGFESMFPSIGGSPASDFDAGIEMLKGKTFLEVMQDMKGGGTVSETDAAKGEAARAKLQGAQSDEQRRQALMEYREAMLGAMETSQKVNEAAGVDLPPPKIPQASGSGDEWELLEDANGNRARRNKMTGEIVEL